MKGIVFTEFIELVESEFGIATVQKIIDECDLSSGGVYTSVGVYDHGEMFQLVDKLSKMKGVPVSDLLTLYGEHFFKVLYRSYPDFFEGHHLFSFLESIDNYIHPQVLKLYPEAELPTFESEIIGKNEMNLIYKSTRKMADFAIGLIRGSAKHFGNQLEIEKISEQKSGEEVVLKLKKVEA